MEQECYTELVEIILTAITDLSADTGDLSISHNERVEKINGSTRSGIEESVKISKLNMNSEETVGEYLARAKTLVKSKIKDATSWHQDIDGADAYHVCNGLIKTGLKSRMLRRVSQFKIYKDLFNHIEEEWE